MPIKADYVAIGNITGMVCSGMIFKSCPITRVDAVKGKDGKLYSLARRYEKVSEFNGRRCWIELKSGANSRYGGAGLWNYISNMFGETFYQRKADGSFKEIDVDRLIFDCKKIN